MEILKNLGDAVLGGKIQDIENLTKEAISADIPPLSVIKDGLMPGMEEVGRRFKAQEMYIPEVLLSAETMKTAVKLLKPLLGDAAVADSGTVIIGTVKGDLHDVGKNIVIMLIEAAGYKVIDLGMDVKQEQFLKAIVDNKADVLGMSAMLTTTMMEMQHVIEYLKKENLRDKVKIIIGGAPVNNVFAEQIGADGYAVDAAAGVDLVKKFTHK